MAKEVALTTVDNPFSPFTQFNDWWKFDFSHNYKTCELLASHANTNCFQSDVCYDEDTIEAMWKIVDLLPETYKVVTPEDFNTPRGES